MLELTQEEREVVTQILQESLSNLREEVYKAETHEWREMLHRREDLLKGVLDRLSAEAGDGR